MTDKRAELDDSSLRQVRIRKRLDDWFLGVVVVLVVLGALGAVLAYQTHATTAVETEEEQVGAWNEQPQLTHHAEVVRSNPIYEQGQTVANQPLYFTHVSPELGGAYAYSYSATGDGDVDVELDAVLRIRAVDGDGDPYWQLTEQLNEVHHEGLSPGDSATISFEINVTEVVAEIERVESGLGASVGTSEVSVLFNARVTGTVNDEGIANSHQSRLDIEPDSTTYGVEAAGVEGETHENVRTVETEVSHGPVQSYGPFGLLLLSLVGIVGLASLKRWGTLAPSRWELDALAHAQQRAEFDDWVSPGAVPDELLSSRRIELDSLEALVDVAIDTNNRVIEDSSIGVYVVVGEDWHYTYATNSQTILGDDRAAVNGEGDDSSAVEVDGEFDESVTGDDEGEDSVTVDGEGDDPTTTDSEGDGTIATDPEGDDSTTTDGQTVSAPDDDRP